MRAVADGCDRFVGVGKVTHHLQDAGIQAQVLRCPPTRDDQGIIVSRVEPVEVGVESKLMPRFLTVCLVPFKVVNGGGDFIASLLAWANRMACVPHHRQHLEGDHDFIVFHEITNKE